MLLGSWNSAILNPKWLSEKVFDIKEETYNMEISMDMFLKTRIKIQDIYFMPTQNNLTIFTSNNVKDVQESFKLIEKATKKIFELLPFTPISAIGHNFIYELGESEVFSLELHFQGANYSALYKKISGKPIESSLVKHTIVLDEDNLVQLNINYKTETKKTLELNYHYKVDNNNDKIKYSLSRYFLNYQHSQNVVDNLIVKIKEKN